MTQVPLTPDSYVIQNPPRPVWYKRTSFFISLAVGVVVLASVLADLPSKVTPASDASAQTSLMNEINSDVAGCAFALQESFLIYRDEVNHTLTRADRSIAPSMLNDDHLSCTLTSSSIYDLANIQGTGSAAGKQINNVAVIALQWTSFDAQTAILDIYNLFERKAKPGTLTSLRHSTTLLMSDRARALTAISTANAETGHPVPPIPAIKLPSVSLP